MRSFPFLLIMVGLSAGAAEAQQGPIVTRPDTSIRFTVEFAPFSVVPRPAPPQAELLFVELGALLSCPMPVLKGDRSNDPMTGRNPSTLFLDGIPMPRVERGCRNPLFQPELGPTFAP